MGPQIGLSRSAVKKSGMIVLQAFLLCSSDLLNVSKNSALSSHGSFLRWVCSEEGTSVLMKCLLSLSDVWDHQVATSGESFGPQAEMSLCLNPSNRTQKVAAEMGSWAWGVGHKWQWYLSMLLKWG